MESLQLKRTAKKPHVSPIGGLELKDGEILICKNASNYYPTRDTEGNKDYVFIGDGENTVSELYAQRKFVRISDKQPPAFNSVYTDAIQNGAVTPEKLSTTYVSAADKDAMEQSLLNIVNSKADEYGQIAKTHFVNCNDYGPDLIFRLESLSDNDLIDNCSVYSPEYLNGLTLVVNFLHAPNSGEIKATLINGDGHKIYLISSTGNRELKDIPLYVGNTPIGSDNRYFWRDNSTVTLVYDASRNRLSLTDTNVLKTLAQWCDENDVTYINGGMIATGTVTANQIQAGSITADKIAAGAITSGMLDPALATYFDTVIDATDSLKDIRNDFNSSNRTAFIEDTSASGETKILTITDDQADILLQGYNGDGHNAIRIGANILVRFENEYKAESGLSLYITLKNSGGSVETDNIRVGYALLDSGNQDQVYTDISKFSWEAGEYRLFTFNGSNWLISKPSSTALGLAQECHIRGLTYIKGGTVVTGRVIADEIEANSITGDKIQAGTIEAKNIAIGNVLDAVNQLPGSINGIVIADGTISAEQIKSNSITTDKLAANSITADRISTGAKQDLTESIANSNTMREKIDATIIENGVITTDTISAVEISANQITSGTISTDYIDFTYEYEEEDSTNSLYQAYIGIKKARGKTVVLEDGQNVEKTTHGLVMYSGPTKINTDNDIDLTSGSRIFLTNGGMRLMHGPTNVTFGGWGNTFHFRNIPTGDSYSAATAAGTTISGHIYVDSSGNLKLGV